MSASQRGLVTALATMLSLGSAQACASYQHPTVGLFEAPMAVEIVSSTGPFLLRTAARPASRTAETCRVQRLRGEFSELSGDTVFLTAVTHVVPAAAGGATCPLGQRGFVVFGEDPSASPAIARAGDSQRGALFLLAIMVAIVVLGASWSDWGYRFTEP